MIPMMITCKKAAELTCQGMDRPLSLWETLRLRFHVLMCAACKGFQRQNEALHRLFEQRFRNPEVTGDDENLPRLPQHTCEQLKRRLREASGEQHSTE